MKLGCNRFLTLFFLGTSLCAIHPASAAERPAFYEIVGAGKSIHQPGKIKQYTQLILDGKTIPLAEAARIRDANQPALDQIRAALERGISYPKVNLKTTLSGELAEVRQGVRLLVVDGHVKLQSSQQEAAANAFLDAVELGAQLPNGHGGLVAALAGSAAEAIGRAPLYQIIPALDAPACRHILTRLQTIERRRAPLSAAFENEKTIILGDFDSLYRLATLETEGKALMPSPTAAQKEFEDYTNLLIANTMAPAGLRRLPVQKPNPLTTTLLESFVKSRWHFDRVRTLADQLQVSLALRTHNLETGAYPAQLSDISRDLLPAIPVDAFGYGQSLQYQRTNSGYRLWSVGPDRKDDGGKPIENLKLKTRGRYMVKPTAQGDVVGGLNY